jgi:hypothetical protein
MRLTCCLSSPVFLFILMRSVWCRSRLIFPELLVAVIILDLIRKGVISCMLPKKKVKTCAVFRNNVVAQLVICFVMFSFLWRYSPNLGLGLPPWNSPFHFGLLDLSHSVGLLCRVISSSQGLFLYTNTEKRTYTNTKHPCPEWDSNPRSRLPSERRQYMP